METLHDNRPDVLSPNGSRVMVLLWILLVGGRYILGALFVASGVATFDQIADWDDHIGIHLYHVLLIVTVSIVALRIVRSRSNRQVTPASDEKVESDRDVLPGVVSFQGAKRSRTP